MSALPLKADIAEGDRHVRFVPEADMGRLIDKPAAEHVKINRIINAANRLAPLEKFFPRLCFA
jgi:hypothetical protein